MGDWKSRFGFHSNFSPDQSSEDDQNADGTPVERRWKALDSLSAEYDHLGTTPPRTRIRNKEKYKSSNASDTSANSESPKIIKVTRRNTMDNLLPKESSNPTQEQITENKRAKRRSLKTIRGHERDLKLDIGSCRMESMPARAIHMLNIPTLVESCNRFMSLCSRPVCPAPRGALQEEPLEQEAPALPPPAPPDTRAAFHATFSMLIRMGNADKNCKRTISVEEHMWQNELKDLVWLEVSARHAGRTTTQQDAYLCAKRGELTNLLHSILQYRFDGDDKCRGVGIWGTQVSIMSSDSGVGGQHSAPNTGDSSPGACCPDKLTLASSDSLHPISENLTSDCSHSECLCIQCSLCSRTVDRALLQVATLLNSLAEAEALYPSTKAMASYFPVIASEDFISKTKAMCLWYNMVHHQRLKLLIIKKLLQTHRWKPSRDKTDTILEDQSEPTVKENTQHKVKFNLESSCTNTYTNSSNELETGTDNCSKTSDRPEATNSGDQSDDDADVRQASSIQIEITRIQTSESNLTDEGHMEMLSDSESKLKNTSLLNVKKANENVDALTDQDLLTKSPYESADSSVGSLNSNESGFGSSINENQHEDLNSHFYDKFNVFELNQLGDVTKLRLFYPNQPSPYREYIEKMLKIRGIRRALFFLEKLHLGVLKKTRMTLEKYEDFMKDDDSAFLAESNEAVEDPNADDLDGEEDADNSDDNFEYERHTRCEVDIKELKKECSDLRRYGAWSKETIDMNLPSYRSLFLFLSTLPLENIHEYLSMKLETKPEKPSVLSIKQLISELREGLSIAVRIRGRFVRHTHTALITEPENSSCRNFYSKVLATFDTTMDEVYKLYLSYLSDWAGMEHLPRATLAGEWLFNGYLARSLRAAATLAPLTFCCLTVRQLDGEADRLKKRVTELGQTADSLSESALDPIEEAHNTIKWRILTVCREMQCLLTEERERALSTAQFARTVSMHLHHNAIFRSYRQKIYRAMAYVQNILCWTIGRMQETTSPKRLMELEDADRPSVQSRTREIVSQGYKFGFEFHKEMCRLITDNLNSELGQNACLGNSISRSQRPKLSRSESISYDNNHTSIEDNYYPLNLFTPTTNPEFQYPPINPKTSFRGMSKEDDNYSYSMPCKRNSKIIRKKSWLSSKFPSFSSIVGGTSLSELDVDYFKNGIPGCEECNRVKAVEDPGVDEVDRVCPVKSSVSEDTMETDWEVTVSRGLVQFAKQWMNFAMERCERGRGLRPRWANHGLEFLMLTCDPQHTKHLTDEEFEKLKAMMDNCISHVIGSSRSSALSTPTSALGTPPPQRTRSSMHFSAHPLSERSVQAALSPTPPAETPTDSQSYPEEAVGYGKQLSALRELDCRRDATLRTTGVIGRVQQGSTPREHFRPRPVTFKWQRGIKIGQGRFGKVYTVVNTESGQLLAMKEVSLGLGDRRAVERAANELQVLEGVVHPNLVRYYGVEIHREEMLIFMELCVEGSLEAFVAGAGANGLPETLIRRFTGQLVSAVRALHTRAIAHRDIKSGNIFLTEGGNCLKLGDFGCAVKIRANTTVPGELQGYIGTQAYMAPEVFMKSSGHGRAADIWSLGCVVVEMASGKRPWSEYDSNYQIMFVVGMGGCPDVPPSLSREGSDFCMSCLQHDPTQRPNVDTLAHHHFLKVNSNEDY